MLSDDKIRKDKQGEKICIVDRLVWHDSNHKPVSDSVDFEYADDVHYKLVYKDWLKFLKDELGCSENMDCQTLLQSYFSTGNCFAFEETLDRINIPYNKNAFY